MHWNKLKNWEKAIFIALLVLAIFTRFYILGDRVMSHDESLHTKFSWYLYAGQGYTHNPMMHGPLLFHLTALAYFLLGVSDFTARFFPALCGVLLVMTPYLFRRWLGKGGTIAAAVLLLLSPSISYYSRYIRHDVFNMLAAVLLLWAILQYWDTFSTEKREDGGGDRWLYALAAFFALLFTTKETSYIYTAIFGVILAVPFLWQILTAQWTKPHLFNFFLLSLALTLVLGGVFAFSLMGAQVQEQSLDENTRMAATVIPLWGKLAVALALAALGTAVTLALFGVGEKSLRRMPLFNLLMVLGTLTLPLGTAIFIHLSDVDMLALASTLTNGDISAAFNNPDLVVSIIITLVVLGSSVLIGLWWDARRWPIIAAIHYGILFLFYTTFFTNPLGVFGGLVGSLAYWLGQQEVARGTQPIYYYLLWMPLYEYLPLLFSVGGGIGAVIYAFSSRSPREDGAEEPAHPTPTFCVTRFFPVALLAWTLLAWALYTLAGERMPWLIVHIALPSIFLAAWGLGRLLDGLDWETLTRRSGAAVWLLPAALLLTLVGLVVFATSVSGRTAILQEGASLAGFSLLQLQSFGQGLGGLIGFGVSLAALIWAVRQVGEEQAARLAALTLALFLALLTVRTMVMFNFINYDMATEFLVYAHGAPDVKVALQQIEDISWRTTGAPHDVKVAYGDNCSWPFSWYMVPYTNAYFYGSSLTSETLLECPVIIAGSPEWEDVDAIVGQDYMHFDYIFRWWPVEDYKRTTWEQARSMLADPAMRAALWDIIWNRDYRKYAEVTETTITLQKWPYRSEFRLYVRRDLASDVWGYRLGDEGAQSTFPTVETTVMPDIYAGHALPSSLAETVALPGAVPRGLAVAADGSLYVADTANHRIWRVNRQGAVLGSWGEQGTGPGQFQEPWGLALDDQGNVYVADTWNHRVQKFDAQGNFLLDWGTVGQFAPGDPNGKGVFFGPRGIAIGPEGRVYVTDTGNKRVQVFDDQGNFLWEFGGQLDEPVGIAISAAGEIFVADTWNRRVQVFSTHGEPLRQWNIPTWYLQDLEEKPYLALDSEDNLYVTDAGHARVLVFDKQGAFLGSAGERQGLLFPAGVAISADGHLYVTDAHSGRALGWTLNADR